MIIPIIIFSLFNSCSRGEELDIIHQVRQLPVLQDIEEGNVNLIEGEHDGARNTAFTYFNFLLEENYSYIENAEGQNSTSVLNVKYYKTKLLTMAEPLYKELMEKYREENAGSSGFRTISNTAFDSCAISSQGDKQMFMGVKGRQVMSVEYVGAEVLSEKIGKLEAVIYSGK